MLQADSWRNESMSFAQTSYESSPYIQEKDDAYIADSERREQQRLEKHINQSYNRLSVGKSSRDSSDDSLGRPVRRNLHTELSDHSQSNSLTQYYSADQLHKYDENANTLPTSFQKSWKSLGSPDEETSPGREVSTRDDQERPYSIAEINRKSIGKVEKLEQENRLSKSMGALDLGDGGRYEGELSAQYPSPASQRNTLQTQSSHHHPGRTVSSGENAELCPWKI